MSEANQPDNSLQRSVGYRPDRPVPMIPIYRWPPQPAAVMKWIFGFPGYLWPLQLAYLILAVLTWLFLTPDQDVIRSGSLMWPAQLLVRNLAFVAAMAGVWHWRLYIKKNQGSSYKYDARWPATDNPTFLFRDQVRDNMFWTICSAVPIWTAYEALILWMQATGHASVLRWDEHPVYLALLVLLVWPWHSFYFYLTHRLLHSRLLYRWVHSLHHKNVNIGPWSGLAMHPVEHLIFFSEVLIYLLIPAHPIHVVLHLQALVFGAVLGHLGFGRLILGKKASMAGDYLHYLHHRHVRVNYGDALVPLDKWFGTLHDGSDKAQEALKNRARTRARRSRASS